MPYLSPLEQEALQLSLTVAFWSMTIGLPFAIAVAWSLSRTQFPGKILLSAIIHLPLIFPPVAIGYILLLVLGRKGIVGAWLYDVFGVSIAFTWQGAVLTAAIMAFPLMVRAIKLSFDQVDRDLETSARTLGAAPLRVFFTISLPLAFPGVIVGSILAFARSLGEFGATITFVANIPGETQTLPLALYSLTQTPGGEAAAARLLAISLCLALAALAASEFLARRVARRNGLGSTGL